MRFVSNNILLLLLVALSSGFRFRGIDDDEDETRRSDIRKQLNDLQYFRSGSWTPNVEKLVVNRALHSFALQQINVAVNQRLIQMKDYYAEINKNSGNSTRARRAADEGVKLSGRSIVELQKLMLEIADPDKNPDYKNLKMELAVLTTLDVTTVDEYGMARYHDDGEFDWEDFETTRYIVMELPARRKRIKNRAFYLKYGRKMGMSNDEIAKELNRPFQDFTYTNWCGPSNVSRDGVELGKHRSLDTCCRTHDYCPTSFLGIEIIKVTKKGLSTKRYKYSM